MNMEQRVEVLPQTQHSDTPQRYLVVDDRNDEINLAELIRSIAREWRLLLAIFLTGVMVSSFYASFSTKMYSVPALLRAPAPHELGDAKAQSLLEIGPVDAIRRVTEKLLTPDTHLQTLVNNRFVEEFSKDRAISSAEVARGVYKNFTLDVIHHDYYQLAKDEKAPLREISISLESDDPELAVRYLQALIDTAKLAAVDSFADDLATLRQTRIEAIEEQIAVLTTAQQRSRQARITRLEEANRETIANYQQQIDLKLRQARQERENRIIRLEEALNTASKLGIEDPVTWDDLRPLRNQSQITNEIGDTNKSSPLYFRGTRFLQAELDQLTSREDDRPFVSGLTELENKILAAQNDPAIAALRQRSDDEIYIEKYDDLQRQLADVLEQPVELFNARFAIVSQPPVVPEAPIRSTMLVMALGIVVSGFLALFVSSCWWSRFVPASATRHSRGLIFRLGVSRSEARSVFCPPRAGKIL